jgi:hypothetical protein
MRYVVCGHKLALCIYIFTSFHAMIHILSDIIYSHVVNVCYVPWIAALLKPNNGDRYGP